MSLSGNIKLEIMKKNVYKTQSKSVLQGIFMSSGSLIVSNGGISFLLSSELEEIINYVRAILTKNYPEATFDVTKVVRSFKNKERFELVSKDESEEVLKGLIEKNTQIPVTIPSFGEKYEVADIPKLEERVEYSKKLEDQYLRLQILEKLDKIKDDIDTMTQNVKNEKLMKENSDEEIEKLNDKVKKLEEQIKGLIN